MRQWLGIILLVAGLAILLFSYSEWNTGRTSAEDFPAEESAVFQKIEREIEREPEILLPSRENISSPLLTTDATHETGEKTASLVIPKIGQKYSVYWGTDIDTLKKGVGMYVSDLTTLPGGHGHTVLSGHRDTVFVRLDELEEKDLLHVEYQNTIFVYEIFDIWITHEDDRTVIVEKDESILTLTTCYPFDFIGYAPDRYIIQAKLIAEKDAVQ